MELINRLEAATGSFGQIEAWDIVEQGPFGTSGPLAELFAAALQGSLDAALALAERLGLSVSQILNEALEGPSGEGIWATGWDPDKPLAPPIAKFVCIAVLKATDTGRE